MYIHEGLCMYMDMYVCICMYIHVRVHTRLYHLQTCMYHFAKSCQVYTEDSR